jgi:hypothetical protein
MDWFANAIEPYYLYIKYIHIMAVMVWIWSTAVAYSYFLVPVFKAWRRNPSDERIVELRNWVMERFDHGAIYEHIAFPIILVTGPLLYLGGAHSTAESWLVLKLAIIVGVFIPIEIMDYYLSHFGGNKHHIRNTGDAEAYERAIHIHWWFFLQTTAAVMIGGFLIVFLAVVKPF